MSDKLIIMWGKNMTSCSPDLLYSVLSVFQLIPPASSVHPAGEPRPVWGAHDDEWLHGRARPGQWCWWSTDGHELHGNGPDANGT